VTNYIFDVSSSILIIFSCSAFSFVLRKLQQSADMHGKIQVQNDLSSVCRFTGNRILSLEHLSTMACEILWPAKKKCNCEPDTALF